MNNTLVKGLRILDLLARSPAPLGVTEIAARAGLVKSDAHRLVQTLVEQRFARQDAHSGAYFPTLRLWELGWAVTGRTEIRKAAEPCMERLLARTRETVHLAALDGPDAVYVHKLESPEPVRAYTEVGGRAPAHAVATGKALLAQSSDVEQRQAALSLKRYTRRTIVDPAEFLRELGRIRAAGFATNRGEWRESVCGVAAPILDASGRAVAAIGLSGPADRMRPTRLKALGRLVVDASRAIGRNLSA
jgi:DNA-binding IclR family transcriptional regulator